MISEIWHLATLTDSLICVHSKKKNYDYYIAINLYKRDHMYVCI